MDRLDEPRLQEKRLVMAYRSGMTLGDNPTNEEIIDALDTISGKGSVGGELDTDGALWAITVVRYVNELGPDKTDPFGHMRWDRVSTVAANEGIVAA
jgi:hypothetical protein